MQLEVRDVSILTAAATQLPWVEYHWCRVIQNKFAATATVSSEMTVYGPSGEIVIQASPASFERSMGYLDGYSGCGGSVIDNNLSHPFGARYRLRYTVTYDDGVSGTIEGEATIRPQ